jgi:Fatty acid desaturase
VETLKVNSLIDDAGHGYVNFRRGLRPRWGRVAADVLLGYAMLIATGWLLARFTPADVPGSILAVVPAAISFGYWMAYLQLFLHEAAHFNLAPARAWNDRIANALIASWVATSIANYRAIHWQHHRFHGATNDTERSYFSALDWRFLLEGLTGLSALRVILFRRARLQGEARAAGAANKWMLVAAMALHGGIVGLALATGHWQVALAWLAGIAVCFPFFGALRQLLEHRDEAASRSTDYRLTPHGRVTRLFRGGPFGSTFGGAGFTRHLLHHWDSSVSYTNLPEVEVFLHRCAAARPHLAMKTTYFRAFRALFGR